VVASDEARLLEALRAGDEDAFTALVDRYGASMLRLARTFVGSTSAAEEVVQDTWLAVVTGLDRFEGRSSLKTWLFTILVNKAKTRAVRDARTIPFSSLEFDADEPAVEPERFLPPGHERWPGHWTSPPVRWDTMPEARLLSAETLARIAEAIAALPEAQREVLTLRDVEGWTADEVCNVLELSESNQRVLLHRARSKVRRALEQYLTE
jgi:RNA polymerase sigma-70 factor (ECF subfamily)